MPTKNRKLIFELSAEERETRFKALLLEEVQRAKALNLPIIYRNELCVKPNMFIHKYPDGRELLIEQDSIFNKKIIKILSDPH